LTLYGRVDRDALVRSRLVYVEPNVVPDVPFVKVVINDLGTIPRHDAWWAP